MKDEIIDNYLYKPVRVRIFDNKTYQGYLYKVINYDYCDNKKQIHRAIINNGYILDIGFGLINLRKSHIKFIEVIK